MKLKSVQIENFRSFRSRQTVRFPDSGLVLIRGLNTGSGDSSGSGKSSLLLAIQWALGCCPFPTNSLANWNQDSGPKVRLELEVDSKVLVIERQPLKLWVDGVQETGSTKQLESRLLQLLGMGPELLELSTYRKQGSRPTFVSMSDSRRKEFLSEVLDLAKVEAVSIQAAKKASEIESEIGIIETKIEILTQKLGPEPREPQKPDLSLADISEWEKMGVAADETARDLRNQVKSVIDKVNSIAEAKIAEFPVFQEPDLTKIEDLRSKVQKCDSKLSELEVSDRVSRLEWTNRRDAVISDVNRTKETLALISSFESQLKKTEAEIAELKNQKCPRCLQNWEQAKTELAKLEATASVLRASIPETKPDMLAAEAELKAIPEWVPNPLGARLREAKSKFLDEIETMRASHEEKRKQHVKIMDTRVAEIRRIASQAIATRTTDLMAQAEAQSAAANRFRTQVSDLRRAESDYAKSVEAFLVSTQRWGRDKAEVESLRSGLSIGRKRLALERDVASATGKDGYLSAIFDEILISVQDCANDILANIANVRHLVLRIDSQREKVSGGVQNKIDIKVLSAGKEIPYEAGLSGGMAAATGLSLDLALGSVLSRRHNRFPGWLVLDEAFDGLGTISKESCLEMLSRHASGRLVLVVDHNSEFHGLFDHAIDIEMVDGESRIV